MHVLYLVNKNNVAIKTENKIGSVLDPATWLNSKNFYVKPFIYYKLIIAIRMVRVKTNNNTYS